MRGFTRAALVARAREVRKATGRIGLVSAAVCDHPEIAALHQTAHGRATEDVTCSASVHFLDGLAGSQMLVARPPAERRDGDAARVGA